MSTTRDYSFDFKKSQLLRLREKIVENIDMNILGAQGYYVNKERKIKINKILPIKIFLS